MSTILEDIYLVKEGCGVSSDDTTVRNRYVFSVLKHTRSTVMRQEANKDQLWSTASAQLLTDFELVETSISENKAYEADIRVYKSVKKVPTLMDTKIGKIVHNIFFDNGVIIEKTEYADWLSVRNRRYKLAGCYWFIRDEHLYVVGYAGGEAITLNIEAIFEDPEEIEKVNCKTPCAFLGDLEFNIPSYIKGRVIELTIATVLGKYRVPADTRNDGRETIPSNP